VVCQEKSVSSLVVDVVGPVEREWVVYTVALWLIGVPCIVDRLVGFRLDDDHVCPMIWDPLRFV
jgi:hypothetical protein